MSDLPTILMAEDHPIMADVFKSYFLKAREKGHLKSDFIHVENGKEAISVLGIAQPHIFLCDIDMPEKDGFEVLKHFIQYHRKQNLYCFFCFVSNAEEEKARAFREGADGFISKKGIDYFPLTLLLKSWLRLVKLEREIGTY